jgi:hypothetical protein
MATRTYATAQDYTKYAEEDWDGDEGLLLKRLRSASIEVEKLTRASIYDVDPEGYPEDADTSEAFAEATCAIMEHWQLTDDPYGVEAAAGAVRIGSVSLGTTSSSADGMSAREKLAQRIGSRVFDILANAGLITSATAHS